MSKTKHTPGPWYVESTKTTHFVLNENEVVICHTEDPMILGDATANARLIAAAPELLEALYQAAKFFNVHASTPAEFKLRDYLEDAIAKATGGAE